MPLRSTHANGWAGASPSEDKKTTRALGNSLRHQLLRHFVVDLGGFQQLLLFDELAGRVRHVDGARPEENRFAPVRQCGNVSSVGGDKRWKIIERAQLSEGNI